MKYAVIDIGSNSVRLLLWADGHTIYKKINTTRLGEGIAFTGALSSAAMERTKAAIAGFCAAAEQDGAEKLYAFATAAVRSAKNGAEFVRLVREDCGVEIDVIGGEKEARLGFLGALGGKDGGIIDVGGASTEITVGKGGEIIYAKSADVGAVRLKDVCGSDREKLAAYIADKISVYREVPRSSMYAIGGTATALAALEKEVEPYDPSIIHGTVLAASSIECWADRLLAMTQEERLALKGMDKKRADILGGAALLLYSVLRHIGAECVTVSEKDNLEGYLLTKLRGDAL